MSLSVLARATGRIELSTFKLRRALNGADLGVKIWCLYLIMLS